MFAVRQRYYLTKSGALRLRYTLPVVAFSLCLLSAFSHPNLPSLSLPSLSVASLQEAFIQTPALPKTLDIAEKTIEMPRLNSKAVERSVQVLNAPQASGIQKAAFAIQKASEPLKITKKIQAGGTLAGALKEAGLKGHEAYYAVQAIAQHFNPKQVRPGQEVTVEFNEDHDAFTGTQYRSLKRVSLALDPIRSVEVRTDNLADYSAKILKKTVISETVSGAAKIQTSLYGSAAQAGIPSRIIAEVIRAYSWDIDFQRDLRRGDEIQVLYAHNVTKGGDFVSYGDVQYASLNVNGRPMEIYRYETKDGRTDYYTMDGQSVRKSLMRTPVDGARISSGYGMRKHPILGYNKMHKGVDFAAPTGTPIYAAGEGTVEYVGARGAYGKYIRLRHNGQLKTAYAHLHKYKSGIRVGSRVEQGDIIGYVGSTGRSTGPHLHYEVLVNNAQVNPNRVDLPIGKRLSGDELDRFQAYAQILRQEYAILQGDLKMAEGDITESSSFIMN